MLFSHVRRLLLFVFGLVVAISPSYAEFENNNAPFVPNYCAHMWNEKGWELAVEGTKHRARELNVHLSPPKIEELARIYFIGLIDRISSLHLKKQVSRASWLTQEFEKLFEEEIKNPSNLEKNLLNRVQFRLRTELVPKAPQGLFSSMSDFNDFLRTHYHNEWIIDNDRLSDVGKLLNQFQKWAESRAKFSERALDHLLKNNSISEDDKFLLINEISAEKRRVSGIEIRDILDVTTLGFMPKTYLDDELNYLIRLRIFTHELERIEAYSEDRRIPTGIREELQNHVSFLIFYRLSIDPTGHLVADSLNALLPKMRY